jgi:hypothetical protein
MRKSILTALFIATATVAPSRGYECLGDPPGYLPGTAKWSSESKDLGYQAYSNNAYPEPCITTFRESMPALGKTIDTETYRCGGITIIMREKYRLCTSSEREGYPTVAGYEALKAEIVARCAKTNLSHDYSTLLVDKKGSVFDLTCYSHRSGTESSCNLIVPGTRLSKETFVYRVGLTDNWIYLVHTKSDTVEMIRQLSL